VTAAGTTDLSDAWLENRDVRILAELVGYHYVTPGGHPYDFHDLSESLVSVDFRREGSLSGKSLSSTWVDAHFRINFAKNKTHEEFGFALALHNLRGVLSAADQQHLEQIGVRAWDICLDLLEACPPHFNLIDAFVSNHGSAGSREPHPLETRTVIASASTLLADWAASLKMGADPYVSPINAKALRAVGLPEGFEIAGSLAPYHGWINVPPLLIDSVRRRNESVVLARITTPWLQKVNRELFPFKNVVNDRINAFATKYLAHPDANFTAYSTLTALNYTIAFGESAWEAYHINFNKDRLRWKETPLGFDTSAYTSADYEAVVQYMEPLQRIILETPPEPNGLRWRYIDNSVLFEFSHVTPIPFRKFVSRVEITRSVQSMNDYIGGACVPVKRDSQGRIIYQAERNIYLPQPNWMAFFSGKHIDVCKLEFVEYKSRSHKIFWRTIASINGSAEFDDGIVAFEAEGRNQTRVTIVARQKFTLPLFWQALNLDLAPKIKNPLVVDAYTRYFRQTIANFETQYQGRESRCGRPAPPQPIDPLEMLAELFGRLGKSLDVADLSSLLANLGLPSIKTRGPGYNVDENGFRHFPGSSSPGLHDRDVTGTLPRIGRETASFFADLSEAMRKDLGLDSESIRKGLVFPA
jgi:hypothetical protein